MADVKRERELLGISEMPQWGTLKKILKEQIDKVCDIDKITSFEEMVGAKFCKKVYNELIRQIDGAKDAIEFDSGKGRE